VWSRAAFSKVSRTHSESPRPLLDAAFSISNRSFGFNLTPVILALRSDFGILGRPSFIIVQQQMLTGSFVIRLSL